VDTETLRDLLHTSPVKDHAIRDWFESVYR
jgi:hypothetical protein